MVLAPHRAVKASAVAATSARGGHRDRAAEVPPADAAGTAGRTGTVADNRGE
jgi:translation initiation factor IF-3